MKLFWELIKVPRDIGGILITAMLVLGLVGNILPAVTIPAFPFLGTEFGPYQPGLWFQKSVLDAAQQSYEGGGGWLMSFWSFLWTVAPTLNTIWLWVLAYALYHYARMRRERGGATENNPGHGEVYTYAFLFFLTLVSNLFPGLWRYGVNSAPATLQVLFASYLAAIQVRHIGKFPFGGALTFCVLALFVWIVGYKQHGPSFVGPETLERITEDEAYGYLEKLPNTYDFTSSVYTVERDAQELQNGDTVLWARRGDVLFIRVPDDEHIIGTHEEFVDKSGRPWSGVVWCNADGSGPLDDLDPKEARTYFINPNGSAYALQATVFPGGDREISTGSQYAEVGRFGILHILAEGPVKLAFNRRTRSDDWSPVLHESGRNTIPLHVTLHTNRTTYGPPRERARLYGEA